MAEMRDLDETDLAIVRLLSENGRRPFSEIAEHVDLSPPAVSDRVDRLLDQGIIRRFTVDIDRSKLQRRRPVLLEFHTPPATVEDVYAAVRGVDGVEHAFQTIDGRVLAHANAPEDRVGAWLRKRLDLAAVSTMDVTLLEAYEWRPGVAEAAFALSCDVCGNAVGSDGVTANFDGDTKTFCCPSCESRYRERYESHAQG